MQPQILFTVISCYTSCVHTNHQSGGFMKSKEDEELSVKPITSVIDTEPDKTQPFLLEPGDIFMVSNRKELKVLHHIARFGQKLAGNDHSDYHHAGIALSKKTLIEMGREEGMRLSDVSSLDGNTISIFRCKNKEVAQLATDLAANLESTLITEEYNDLKTDKANITYGNWNPSINWLKILSFQKINFVLKWLSYSITSRLKF
jgi:hypothetical protein